MRGDSIRRAAALLAALLLAGAAAGDLIYGDFRDTEALRLLGACNQTAGRLRLTPSRPGQTGSAWYGAKQSVVGGFVTDFAFRLSLDADQRHPGPCKLTEMDEALCSRRGGNGFAFVLQNAGEHSLGAGAESLGYGGIANALAVEFDTWHDASVRDPYENHVAVLTRGVHELRPDHGNHLGSTVKVPNLSDGASHLARVEYFPTWRNELALHPSFVAAPFLGKLMQGLRRGADRGKWWQPAEPPAQHGLGVLRVFVDDLADPVLTVPVNLGAHLGLDQGRAWVGFTSATGAAYQNHEIGNWTLSEVLSDPFMFEARHRAQPGD